MPRVRVVVVVVVVAAPPVGYFRRVPPKLVRGRAQDAIDPLVALVLARRQGQLRERRRRGHRREAHMPGARVRMLRGHVHVIPREPEVSLVFRVGRARASRSATRDARARAAVVVVAAAAAHAVTAQERSGRRESDSVARLAAREQPRRGRRQQRRDRDLKERLARAAAHGDASRVDAQRRRDAHLEAAAAPVAVHVHERPAVVVDEARDRGGDVRARVRGHAPRATGRRARTRRV
eukprot:31499-Pelagococcus_subviridis.AAC.45